MSVSFTVRFHALCPGCCTIIQEMPSKTSDSLAARYATVEYMAEAGLECKNCSCAVHIEGVAAFLPKTLLASDCSRHVMQATGKHDKVSAQGSSNTAPRPFANNVPKEEMPYDSRETIDGDRSDTSSRSSDGLKIDPSLLDPQLQAQMSSSPTTSEDTSNTHASQDKDAWPNKITHAQATPQTAPSEDYLRSLKAALQAQAAGQSVPFQITRVQRANQIQSLTGPRRPGVGGPAQSISLPAQTFQGYAHHAAQLRAFQLQAARSLPAHPQMLGSPVVDPAGGTAVASAGAQGLHPQAFQPQIARAHAVGVREAQHHAVNMQLARIQAARHRAVPPHHARPQQVTAAFQRRAQTGRPQGLKPKGSIRHSFTDWENQLILGMRHAGSSFVEISKRLPRHTARSIESKWHTLTKGRPSKTKPKQPGHEGGAPGVQMRI